MTKLIAETAWHHEGDFKFMKSLVSDLCQISNADIIKMHITLDFDEYMSPDHEIYTYLKHMLFNWDQWQELINDAKTFGKEVVLLVNDTRAIDLVAASNARMIEIHSSVLGDLDLLKAVNNKLDKNIEVFLGIGGGTLAEIDLALETLDTNNVVFMFGFQNYPTNYADVNFNKIRELINMYPGYKYGYADHTAWDEPNNTMISLMGAAIGMEYLEKHVTNQYGVERLDWQSTISMDMCKELAENLSILNQCNGNGGLELNEAEKRYSVYGPMKKAIILKRAVNKGDSVKLDDFIYRRTSLISDIPVTKIVGDKSYFYGADLSEGHVLSTSDLHVLN